MKLETVKNQILSLEQKIDKKQALIQKKQRLIEKKSNYLKSLGINDNIFTLTQEQRSYYISKFGADFMSNLIDIETYGEDIERLNKEIPELEIKLANLKSNLEQIESKETEYENFPEIFTKLQLELVSVWDEWDKIRIKNLTKEYNELGYKEFSKKHRMCWSEINELLHTSDEKIHNKNLEDAKNLIINMYERVKEITGEVTNWNNIYLTQGAHGFATLNGFVEGKEGKCNIESIIAGGEVQRLHIRVLVHKLKS